MSYDLGHSRGYIYNISSGKSLLPLSELFAICDYFGITPADLFDDSISTPELIRKAVEGMKQLDDGDQLMILNHINRLLKNNNLERIIATDNFDVKLDIEPKDNYSKARQAIIQAMEAISKLSPIEQDKLARELLTTEKYNMLISLLQRR